MEMSDLYQLGRRLAEIALEDMGADAPHLAPGEFLVLQDLFLNGRSAVGDIAKRTGLAQSRVSTSVRALAGRNWVTTAADPSDGRKTLVDVTEPIRAAGQQRRAGRADKALTNALARADDTERAALIAALERLHQLLVAGRTQRRFPDTVTP
ncbi:transcriptional regulator, MarR family protein [Streptomyces sparsogenes DSM 40356]|uniref:Transcriptional regulator, MarR family protein n=2 Tax=Streptomyces sparsogenes TaxID=67365 RepID=A0A1R1SBC5_9ACTN|nr:transcriptional regulator, MarR family protein [Streptomyces sparsogenes DSM 40356]